MIFLGTIFAIIGLLILLMGYLIRYKKQAWMISGYNEEQVTDKDALCNWFGGVFMLLGIYTVLTAFLLWWRPGYVIPIVAAFVVFDIAAIAIAKAGGKKFWKKA
ncbi:hypothetical protein BH09BAC6_BH09BAC6_35000 [soil metagenome]